MLKNIIQLNGAINLQLHILILIINTHISRPEHDSQRNSCLDCNIETNCAVLRDALDRAVAVTSASSAAFLDIG